MINEWFTESGNAFATVAIAVLLTSSAILTFGRVVFEIAEYRWSFARVLIAFGFTLWAIRFWYTILSGGEVYIAPLSQIAISTTAFGHSILQLLALSRLRYFAQLPTVYCVHNPEVVCHRVDRMEAALLKEKRK